VQNSSIRKKRLRNFDKLLNLIPNIKIPQHGWLKEIRTLLGMPLCYVAKEAGIHSSNVGRAEKSEADKTISLRTLERLANALGCDVKYILVPRQRLETFIENQALRKARDLVAPVVQSMTLENQKVSKEKTEEEIRDLANELINGNIKLWE